MKKIILIAVFLTIQFLGLEAFAANTKLSCTPTITTSTISSTTICAGTVIGVPFVLTDCVDPGNVFTVQLSDATGSFTSPTNIGSSAGTTSGTIVAIIPPTTTFGSGYRIRVISSSPVTIGSDNGVDLVLLPKPSATFSINNALQCINGNSFIYTNTSTGSITNYNWKLGDGISTTQTNVVYSYAAAGTFNVMLTATGTNGCKDSTTQVVTVQAKPVANFSYAGPSLCSTPDFNFTNTTASSGSLTSNWYFGDGDTSTTTNPDHTFAAAGTYSVRLIVQGTNGCIDSITKTISVLDKPTASFLVNNATQCLSGNNFSFPNFSTGVGNTYLWQFGDGTTSTVINATKTYSNIGTYTVKLIVTNINGCKDSTTQAVDVTSSPLVNFTTGNTLCSIGLNVLFNNSSNAANSYNWSFGDGTFSTNANPSKTYATTGTYNVKLVATGSGGCKDSVTQTIVVNTKASADFSINNDNQCINGNLFTLSNNTSGIGNTYSWSFGDGITSVLTSPSKTYNVAGNYIVKLVVTNANGCIDSISKNVTVANKPTTNFTVAGNTSCSSTLNVSMNNTSTGVANTYVWDFGDGTNSTLSNPSKTYASTGSYVIRLVATNIAGCKDSTERSLTFATKPTAAFTVNSNSQCTVSNTFTFTNSSVGGTIYNWSFGDGFTSTATNPTKQYTSAGTYTVKLVVTNASGCKDSVTQVVSVLAKPTADFTISGGTGCSSNLTIQLINLSSGSTPSYSWDFGDGTSSTAISPSKTYSTTGNYTIKLVVTNANGCKDSISLNFTLSAKPIANFTINNSNQCENTNLFTFTNTTTGATTYNWSFGDGFTSTATNPTKQYITTGTYTVKLVATSLNGCVDSISKTVTVVPKPSAGFTISGATGCTNNRTISLTNTSTGTGNTFSWDFGDGNTSTTTSPTTTYTATGTYAIKIVVTNINGCKDSTSQIITFNALPAAAISLAGGTNATQCFNGNSFALNGNPASGVIYNWSFGDGGISTLSNPIKSYSSVGNYTVKLVVTNSLGCKDSTTTSVTVLTSPTANYTLTGATGCTANRTLNFINTSTGAGLYLWSFGDNTGTPSVSPSKTYATTAGTYNVQLLALNANGCRDSVTQIVSFKSLPTAAIAFAGNTTQCVNSNAFLLVDNSTGASTYSWNFGDGTTSSFKDPSVKVYTVAGNYTVKHYATSSDGCSDSTTLNLNILAAPVPNFTITGLDFCGNNLPITFNNTSTGIGNTYLWRLGDGTTSTATSPTKTYTLTGSYTVRLIVTSANGCVDSVAQIVQFAPKATANFSLNSGNSIKCLRGNNFSLLNTSTNTTSGTTYLWTYGDGTTSTLANPPNKSYSVAGTYSVMLTITNSNGCIDSSGRLNLVVNANPTAAFAINGGGCTSSLTIGLTNNSTPNNATNFYSWSFGDATTSNVTNPTKTYPAIGSYAVRLIADNNNNCSDTVTQIVNFFQQPAVGINMLSNRTQCLNGNSYTVSNNSLFTSSYLWQFGDGTTSTSPTPPAKTYTAAGVYTIKLIGTTIDGCKDSTTETATVIANPNAVFTATYQTCGNTNVRFVQIDSSTTVSSAWYFGDGNGPSDVSSANHTYATRGSYIVKYFAYDATFTCVDSATQIVTFAPLPVAGITHLSTMNLTQCANGNAFSFSDASTNAASYLWNFGDGTTSTLQNPPTHSYSLPGNYIIKLVITSAAGCKDSTTQNVTVNPSPNASFSNGYNACTFVSQSFQNVIANTVTSVWDFGDGSGLNASVGATVNHTYPGAGTYILKHIATSANGCVDSSSVIITAAPKPIAAINSTGINLTQCLNSNSFTFANNSTNATIYSWNFGDGNSSTAITPTHQYTTAGTYIVKLFVSTITGCKDSTTLVVTILPSPQAAFVPTYNACGLSAQFVQTTTANTAFGVWDFGDGSIVNGGATQNHTYPSIGTYNVKYVVYNASSTCSDSAVQVITFFATPVAGINLNSSSSQCLSGNNFLFTDNSTNATTHSWNFGDGTTSTLANPPSHTYVSAGTYTIKHIAFNSSCKDSTTVTVNVLANPNATFSSNYVACNNLTAQFAQTNNANTLSSTWIFGDGNTTNNVASTSHTYPSIGSYIVKYVAQNAACADSSSQTITFTTAPVAGINSSSLSSQCLNGNSFTFTDNSTNAATYSWSFGDGTTSTLTNPPTHTYLNAGTFTVKLFVTNISGCSDSTTVTINVVAKPVAAFTTNGATNCTSNLTVTTTNTSTNAVSYVWSFGDATTSTLTNPSHTYSVSGTYTIKLVATNAAGCKDSVSQTITISTKPVAAFTITALTQCLTGGTLQFTDASIGTVTPSYYYDFGDGTLSFLQNPTKAYLAAGTYIVKQIVTNANGCKDSITKNVVVDVKPVASFNVPNFTTCTNTNSITFANTSTNATNYVWSFGDGVDSISANPTHTYAALGTYTVKLVAANSSGCKDSTTRTITLTAKPTAGFTSAFGQNLTQCLTNNSFTYFDNSIGATNYFWNFGDGTTSTLANPLPHKYANAGVYVVKQIVTNINGCKDSTSLTVTVLASPVASFNLIGATSCTANTSITTNNTSTGGNNTYAWDLGDGSSSFVTNPSHTYTIAGTYNIKLVATNSITGCKDSVTKPVTFSTNPTAAFTANNSNQCVNNNNFVFTNTSVGGATYSWNFGDATTSTSASPNKVYTSVGVYNVKLIVTTANGCKDSITKVVTVLTKPTALFNVVGTIACSSNLTIALNNTSTGTGNTYVWSFGDGTNSIAANPSKTYTNIGTYTIKLVVANGNGCVDSITQDITISTKPLAAFTVSDTLQCVNGSQIIFTNASTNTVTPAYYYDFGDGTFSLVQNPTKVYTTAGTYIVKMFVTNANGCKDSTTKTIRIVSKPIASFTIPSYNGCGNAATSFAFSNTSTNATSYVWDFGDGTTSTLTNPTKTYSSAGTFIVKLIAINANGCKDSSSQSISFIAKPIAGFTVSSTGACSNNTFTFTDTSKVTGTSNYYYYDFGDGTFSLLQNPTKAFALAGTYKIILFVTNSNGCKDSTSKTILVAAKPTASFTIANYTSCSNNNTLSFVNGSTNATNYVWSFGDGVDSTSTNPTHTYLSLGTYNVKLVATNVSGCKDSATQTINLIAKPIVAFSYTSSGSCSNNAFAFTDASTVSGIATYYYDFGDGTFSLAKNPTKVFTAAGTYKVILFVTNANGCKDSLSKTITVLAAPKAAFTLSNFNPCSNNYTATTVNTSTNATSYFWDFGDGILTNQTNITKTFAGIGTYTITLIATNANGCTDTARQTISFTTKPIAAFNVSSLGGCVNNIFSFSDNSTVSGTPSYYYNFGDGVTSLLPNTTHSYSIAGTYKVIYVVTNSNGCKDSTNQTLIVTAKPKAAFTTPNTGGCSNSNSFSFTNTSNNAVSYIWDFGDGTGATTTNATKTYAGTGTFIVRLIAMSATGCSDTTSQTFTIIPKPIASFNVSSLGGCINNSFSFSDNSTVNGVATYFYDFGDATISLLPNPTHTYTAVGTYKVMFFVTNSNGCKDSTSRIITVTTNPTASFSLSGLIPCSNTNTITLVNSSIGATSYAWNFGDGNGSTLANPTKTYTTVGTYKITLFATNANGCVDSTSQTITLTSKPTAAFSVSSTSQCLTTNSFLFTNNSIGNITSIIWNFGDGTNSSASNPTKVYTTAGVYTVTITVTNANGCSDVATQVVSVTAKPVVAYTINNATQCILSNVFTFTNTSPNQTGVTYFWNFGDGILSSLNTISKVYTSTGTFTISLIAVNSNGCVDSLVKTVTVLAKPTPSFTVNSSVQCVNNSFVFTNTAVSTAANYTWRFGDGTTSTSTSPTHSYSVGGTYIVTLIAFNAGGCVDSTSKTIFVAAKPVASFATSINNICADPTTVTFNNTTTGSFSSLIWAFSDGTISTDVSPKKTFATAGTYTAKLLVLSSGGCRDSVSQSFTILPKLSAVFSFNSITQCINNNSFTFENATINTGLNSYTYKWDLGDGTLASTSAVTKSYLLPGNYTVKLLIINDTTGCRDSVSQVVSVKAQPTATLSGNGTICQGNSFIINATFTGTPPFSFTYTDGTSNYFVSNVTSNLYGLGVSPLVTSTYSIISMNDANCSASTAQLTSTKSIVIVDTAKFTTQPISKSSCVGNTVLYTTKLSTNALVTYQWQKNGVDIIGANSDSLKLTNITSLDAGTYRLIVVLPCGSIYSSNATLFVNQPAVPPIYTAAVKYCQLDTAKPLVAAGNILTWYSVQTGGLGTAIAPVPNTLIVGTQTYWVSNNNLTNCESARYPVTITILPKPTVSLIAIGNTELQPTQTVLLKATASANALGIRWYYNDLPIGTFPSNQNLVGFSGVGKYQVDALTAEGCTARSEVIQVTSPTGLASASEGNNLRLYPNPATSFVNMYFDNPLNQDATVRLITATGQILQSKAVKFTNRFQPVQLYVANLRADVYAIEVINSRGFTIARNLFIKAK